MQKRNNTDMIRAVSPSKHIIFSIMYKLYIENLCCPKICLKLTKFITQN